MAVELRPRTAVLLLLLVLAAGSIGSAVVTDAVSEEYDATVEAVTLEEVDGEERHLWLFTSQGRSFEQQTLAINVVVYGDPDDVRRRLLEDGRGDWDEIEEDEEDVAPAETAEEFNATSTQWEVADGANRYVYLTGTEGGMWLSESYQIHDGDYLGSRHHVRAYTSPRGAEWTALQTHHDHWDLFGTRHVVTDVEGSQAYLEGEFLDAPGARGVTREYVGGGDRRHFDGWLTVVDFREEEGGSMTAAALLLVLLGATTARLSDVLAVFEGEYPEREVRTLLLAGGIVALFLFVRLAGVGLERSIDVPPKAIAALLYPLIFAGIPIVGYLLARPLERKWAFSGASIGLLTAILVDYSYLGVSHLPLDVLVHRATLAVALGLIAGGGSRAEGTDTVRDSYVRVGVLLWLVAVVHPLLRHTPLPV